MKDERFMEKAWALLSSGKYEKALKGKQVAVIGAGGAGENIVLDMVRNGLNEMEGVDSVVINSDEAMMERCKSVKKRMLIGKNIDPNPKGANGSRKIAKKMVETAKESIEVLIKPYPVVVIIAGLGGGTGSELILEVTRMSVRKGKMTLAIPVLPFSAEASRRGVAKLVLEELRTTGAKVVEMDNDMLMKPELMGLPSERAFGILNRVIQNKIADLHSAARKALMDEIVKDIIANMPPEDIAISSAEQMETPSQSVGVPDAITAETDGMFNASNGDLPPAAQ